MTMDSYGNCIKKRVVIWKCQCAQDIVIPQGSFSAVTPQSAFSLASSIHLGAIHLLTEGFIGNPYVVSGSPIRAFGDDVPIQPFGNDGRVKSVNKTKRRVDFSHCLLAGNHE